jgi:hypothetical protein
MSAWNHLNWTSIALALPMIGAGAWLAKRYSDAWTRFAVSMEARSRLLLALALLSVFILYLSTLTPMATFDEYSYAMAARGHVFYHPNHYLSHLLVRLWYLPYSAVTGSVDSLRAAQVFNAAVGTMNVWLFYRCARYVFDQRSLAVLFSAVFGFACWTWKYAISGEVYPVMVTCLLATLWQWARMVRNEFWDIKNIVWLGTLMNLCVLAHNVSSVIALAYGIPLLLRRPRVLLKLAPIGLALFVLFQGIPAYLHGKRSVGEWWRHNLYYTDYAKNNNLVSFTFPKNAVIVARDGTFTAIAGLENNVALMPLGSKIITAFLYAFYWALFLTLGYLIVRRLREISGLFKDPYFAVVTGHLGVFGIFSCFWAVGNDEMLHWLTPFFLLVCGFVLRLGPTQGFPALALAAAALFLPWMSYGTSAVSSSKIRLHSDPARNLRANTRALQLQKGQAVIISESREKWVAMTYFLGETSRPPESRAAIEGLLREGKIVYVVQDALDEAPDFYRHAELERVNDIYTRLNALPSGKDWPATQYPLVIHRPMWKASGSE